MNSEKIVKSFDNIIEGKLLLKEKYFLLVFVKDKNIKN